MPLFGNKEVPEAAVLDQQENHRKSDFLVDEENMASVITMFIMYTLMTTITAVNIALNKPTGQIGAYGGATSDKAVDGHYDVDDGSDDYLSVCAHPDTIWLQGSREQKYMTLCEVEIDGFIMITSSFTTTTTPTTTTTTTTSTTSTTTSTTSKSTTVRTSTSPTTSTTTTTTTNMTDQPKPITSTSTLPWVLFGVSCVINIIFATLYFFARKQLSQLSQPSNHSENSTHGQTTLSYINNSSDVGIENQQPINTQNIDSNGYEDVNIRNIHLTERQREDMITEKTPQYERLQGQVSDDVTNTHYESIH
ncbi:hypothetical protein LSH36_340g04012 [Paralvinella palmiformis]|uniref:Uncharacterized protein n=1 Tax=Paralvinella palmiformis TaxID=53620 RepID=A0AAD9JFB0_9ANNE|nr:hypothetical protein LSH36_340g04012 [Paralvinella palmiformis]